MDYINIGAWDIRVTIDLYLGGIGVGAFLLSVLMSFYDVEKHTRSIKLGAYVAPISVGLGLILLITKLGVPGKFLTTLWNTNSQSVMSIGSFLQTGFVIIALYYALLIYRGTKPGVRLRVVQTIGSVFALSVALYHGLYLSSLGRVLWSELTSGMFMASSFTSGIAFIMILRHLLFANQIEGPSKMNNANLPLGLDRYQVLFFVFLMVQLVSIVLWQFYSGRLDLAQEHSYNYFMGNYGMIWTFVVLIGGTIIPTLIALYSLIQKQENMSAGITFLIGILILVGGFAMKHLIIIGGQIQIPISFNF